MAPSKKNVTWAELERAYLWAWPVIRKLRLHQLQHSEGLLPQLRLLQLRLDDKVQCGGERGAQREHVTLLGRGALVK